MEYFRSFSPQTRDQTIRCLSGIYPDDIAKFKRMRYNQLYAIYKQSNMRIYGFTSNPTQSKRLNVSHASRVNKQTLCRNVISTSAVERATTVGIANQISIQKGRCVR